MCFWTEPVAALCQRVEGQNGWPGTLTPHGFTSHRLEVREA